MSQILSLSYQILMEKIIKSSRCSPCGEDTGKKTAAIGEQGQ